jgi:hypothetical protein
MSEDQQAPGLPTDGMPGIEFDEVFEEQYLRTGNPLYVWQALNSLHVYGTMWALSRGFLPSTPRAIPVWCIRYLVEVAARMSSLGHLLDERLRPNDSEGFDALREWKPSLTPSEAAHRLNDALGIDGTSFTKLQTARQKYSAFLEFENLIAEGLTKKAASERIGEKFGWEDERTVRRYMAEQRLLMDRLENEARDAGKNSPNVLPGPNRT